MAISFAAGAEYIQTPGNFTELNVGTVALWLYPRSVSGNNRIIGTDTLWEARLSGSDMLHEFRQSAVPNMTTVFAINTWYHVVFTFDGTNKGAYVDGAVDVAFGPNTNGTTGTSNMLTLGSSDWNLTQGMNGDLEDVRIYNRVLSQKEVQQIYNGEGQDFILDGLQHWWTMNQGAEGSTVVSEEDLIGKVNMTVVAGTPSYVKTERSFIGGPI